MNPDEARKIAFHNAARVIPFTMQDRVKGADLWSDIRQEIDILTWQAEQESWTIQQLSNAAKRAVYRTLRDNALLPRQQNFNPERDEPATSASMQTVVLAGECGIKQCHCCRKFLHVEQFAFDARRGDRLTLKCRACQAVVNRKSYQGRNKEIESENTHREEKCSSG
jgi:hypothetical protein